ncbi:MAG: prolyl oligopeptidase family serine peptidase [Ignavibacteriales bacterium]|nr:prolyl oligopeptidase family serine peptidase [Ignavibacteriales bacterium]
MFSVAQLQVLIYLMILVPIILKGQQADTLVFMDGIALQLPQDYTETIIAPNPVEANLALGKWKAPKKGQSVKFINGEEHEWQTITADSTGWFTDSVLNGCYVYFSVDMKKQSIWILEAMGNEMAYVNGVPRSGNPYGLKEKWETWEPNFQYSKLPIVLEKGKNELLVRCQRGRLKMKLYPPAKSIMFNPYDATLPDFIVGEKIDTWASIVIVNASMEVLKDVQIKASINPHNGNAVQVPIIQPLSVRKVGFHILGNAFTVSGKVFIYVAIVRKKLGKEVLVDSVSIPFRVLNKKDNHKETFISKIDGSVQYYSINPASDTNGYTPKALFLSLHGAGVEAINQSGSYYLKSWGHIVAPTNRRPYGYNWEDWGRMDALEVLDTVKNRHKIDESRIYLTGHSMGGHGTWHIGSLFPDKFSAIGPSAGWISFWTYRFRGQNTLDTTDIRKMIRRSTAPSETFQHVENYKQLGMYILHGADDDNVYPKQARMMVEELNKHNYRDFIYHEQKDVGHWWDLSDEPSADCVDWSPMFDFFARHSRPEKERVREINFITSNPGISAKNNWVTIDAQREQLKISSVSVRFDPGTQRFIGATNNVARIAFDLDVLKRRDSVSIELDSQKIGRVPILPNQQQFWLENKSGKWRLCFESSQNVKNSRRYGIFKEAFRSRFVFVYGTQGSDEENKWAFDKARYDAEKFWYQGNGSIDIFADKDFDPSKHPDRSVILYGNRNTNSAWKKLLNDSPIQVGNNFITVGGKKFTGSQLGCIFVRPRKGNANASVAVIGGSGLVGMKLTTRIPYMSPGIGLPDLTLFNSDIVTKGEKGILGVGFFGLDWSVENGDFIWQSN